MLVCIPLSIPETVLFIMLALMDTVEGVVVVVYTAEQILVEEDG
jgi:hypothetical protein